MTRQFDRDLKHARWGVLAALVLNAAVSLWFLTFRWPQKLEVIANAAYGVALAVEYWRLGQLQDLRDQAQHLRDESLLLRSVFTPTDGEKEHDV